MLTQYAKDCPARNNAHEAKTKMLLIAHDLEEATVEAEKPKKKSAPKKMKADAE